jgi:hypothetical protein
MAAVPAEHHALAVNRRDAAPDSVLNAYHGLCAGGAAFRRC